MMKKLFHTLLMTLSLLFGISQAHGENAIQPFGTDSLNRIKSSHSGQPFVLVLWSLDCTYCLASLHTLAKLQRSRGIDIVTVSTDRNDEIHNPLILKKLAASGIKSETWAFGAAPAEQLRYAIDPKWRGEMPRTYWFDKEGKSVAYSGAVTAEVAARLMPQ